MAAQADRRPPRPRPRQVRLKTKLTSAHNYLRLLKYLRYVVWAGAAVMPDMPIYQNRIFHTWVTSVGHIVWVMVMV